MCFYSLNTLNLAINMKYLCHKSLPQHACKELFSYTELEGSVSRYQILICNTNIGQ